jgi:hypothetical protein
VILSLSVFLVFFCFLYFLFVLLLFSAIWPLVSTSFYPLRMYT